MKIIDLRSDTVTEPTEEMRKAAASAAVGDDVYGDDPTVNELEYYAAELVGKEEALFVTSGTQGNLVSVLAQTNIGDEVLLEEESHIYHYEVGGLSAVGGTIPRRLNSNKGYIDKNTIELNINEEYKDRSDTGIHHPTSRLLCLENTHNRHGGIALTPSQIKDMADVAHQHGLRVHLDGARIFNASVYHNTDVKNYTKHVDSIQFCLSKGLSAPVGSIVAGDAEFIKKARKKRKMLGGGMRQAGIIAAPGLIALKDMRDRLVVDHVNASTLAQGLKDLGLDVWPQQTNIVVCDISKIFTNSLEAVAKLKQAGILCVDFGKDLVRMTTHRMISEEDVSYALEQIPKYWLK